MPTTQAVFDHHNETFANLNLDDVMEDYTEDSVIVSNIGTFSGLDDIRAMFDDFFEEFDHPDAWFEVQEAVVEGEIGYTVWDAESPEHRNEFGTDTFVIRDVAIEYQTFAALVDPNE